MTPSSRFLKKRGIPPILAAAAFLLLVTLACDTSGCFAFLRSQSRHFSTLTIDSPADGSEVPVNTPVEVVASYRLSEQGQSAHFSRISVDIEGAGVLFSSGEVQGDGQPEYTYTTTVTPTEAGSMTIRGYAHDEFGDTHTASATVQVVAAGAVGDQGAQGAVGAQGQPGPEATCGDGVIEGSEACEPSTGGCAAGQTCNASTCQCESSGTVTASASTSGTTQVNLRPNPGPGCEPATLNSDSTLILDARSSTEPLWYHVQGDGWVYSGALEEAGWTFEPDPSTLPVDENAVGCLYCGDGVCSPEIDEAANTCEADCPAVCGDGYVTHDEACDPPESEPADPAYGEEPVTWCNDSCQFSTKEPPAEPPFDDSACGATCDVDADCPSGFSCVDPGICAHASCP